MAETPAAVSVLWRLRARVWLRRSSSGTAARDAPAAIRDNYHVHEGRWEVFRPFPFRFCQILDVLTIMGAVRVWEFRDFATLAFDTLGVQVR